MNDITSEKQINLLVERYPFNEEELEILARAHEHVSELIPTKDDTSEPESYLLSLAKASPYTFYFLPGDELKKRISFIEDYVLPQGFASSLRATISSSTFVLYANQGINRSLETFLEGLACIGRRGIPEAARSFYSIAGYEPTAEDLADLAVRLTIATEVLSNPNFDRHIAMKRLSSLGSLVLPISDCLQTDIAERISEKKFIQVVEKDLPMFTSPLATFIHLVLFHGEKMSPRTIPYVAANLDEASSIFTSRNMAYLTVLSFMSPLLAGKVS